MQFYINFANFRYFLYFSSAILPPEFIRQNST